MIGFTAVAVLAFAYLVLKLRRDLHMLQQNSYREERYRRWREGHKDDNCPKREYLFYFGLGMWAVFGGKWFLLPLGMLALLLISYKRPAEIIPLKMTPRATRLLHTAWAFAAAGCVAAAACARFGLVGRLAGGVLLVLAVGESWRIMLAAASYRAPKEAAINAAFAKEAHDMIAAAPNLKVVGVTGSFGKTSSKLILASMLEEQFLTLATPESYNTPMGVTRVVREKLRPIDEVFVCEMGARQKGDIAELCELAQPVVGLLTAIGEQHLETFHNIETIIDTKFELIAALPEDGVAVLNCENEHIAANTHRAKCKVLRYGFSPEFDYYADEIDYGPRGAEFTLHAPEGRSCRFRSALLGRHNILNIVGAAAAADALGLPLAKAARGVARLAPLPHRLQLLERGELHVLDDAYNSNPAGAASALEVLSLLGEGKKILITPGMVELGEREYQLNYEFAQAACKVCDYIILVGKNHSRPLQDGVRDAGFDASRCYVAADLADAQRYLASIAAAGDTVLYENDLPDTYKENA
ncbi:MAG: UDP-N-acetylmuramoyl-tripeptide--D-alanyl-D-alanine ligase [Firmicutes bacterium]|nr:UDP-N-acetylmuramoyl-tripeptide--D-alanyl-D-alanine ligase [Bacillota bacterium]